MPLFVGIDVSSKNLEACLMDAAGETLVTRTVTNNFPGVSELKDVILQHAKPGDTIQIAMEATSVYSWHPAMFFHEDPELKQRQTKVFTLNPKLVKNFKKAYAEMDTYCCFLRVSVLSQFSV
jgi:transposase